MLVKFEQNRMVQTTRNFALFDKTKNKTKQNKNKNKTKNKTKQNKKTKQNGFFITIFDKELVFQILRHFDTCNKVKRYTKHAKHGRPDQSQRELRGHTTK